MRKLRIDLYSDSSYVISCRYMISNWYPSTTFWCQNRKMVCFKQRKNIIHSNSTCLIWHIGGFFLKKRCWGDRISCWVSKRWSHSLKIVKIALPQVFLFKKRKRISTVLDSEGWNPNARVSFYKNCPHIMSESPMFHGNDYVIMA